MTFAKTCALCLAAWLSLNQPLDAQEHPAPPSGQPVSPPDVVPAPAPEAAVTAEAATESAPADAAPLIAEGTYIVVRIDAAVSSRTAKQGDMFPISLAEPLKVDGVEIIPAGISGEGQVVHAQGRGFGGRAGELIVAGRYLMWGDQRIPLRGMRISRAGANNAAEAIAASAVLSVAGLFVTGTSVDLPIGQIAVARIAQPILAQPTMTEHTPDRDAVVSQGEEE